MRYLSFLLLFLTACASYRSMPLDTPGPICCPQEPVAMRAKTYNLYDCKRYLDRNVIAEGYQPVQLFVQNSSDKSYLFSLNRVSLPCARSDEVAQLVHTSTVGRVVGYSAAAVFTCGLFAIPAVVDGIKSAEANQMLDYDYFAKSAKDQLIPPHSYFNAILFVPRCAYHPNFDVTLLEWETNTCKHFRVCAG